MYAFGFQKRLIRYDNMVKKKKASLKYLEHFQNKLFQNKLHFNSIKFIFRETANQPELIK